VQLTDFGKSGLGLEAQRKAVEGLLNGGNRHLVKAFVNIESGKRTDRPELAKALQACRPSALVGQNGLIV
jgi:DNA invertase Pin-like site-specific DNA recombinase